MMVILHYLLNFNMKNKFIIAGLFLFFPATAKAHCPLCTAGAGFLAIWATYLGVSSYIIGIMIGAFAMALAFWVPRIIKKKYMPYQDIFLMIIIFFSTIIPIMPFIQDYTSFNIYWFGEYGGVFNKTYMVSRFLIGSFIGAFVMFVSPYISKKIIKIRSGKLVPYQGILITFFILLTTSLLFQYSI